MSQHYPPPFWAKNLSSRNRPIAISASVILLAGGLYAISLRAGEEPNPEPQTPGVSLEFKNEPTTFLRAGVIVFNNPGLKSDVPYLLYETPGKPAQTAELILDELSVCSAENGSAPCVAMSVSLDIPFHGKRAVVEGLARAPGILVRKLQILREGEEARIGTPGSVFISWPQAIAFIEQCAVKQVMQTHALDVYLTLDDGQRVRAVEPVIDEVFGVTNRTRGACGNIVLATE